MDVSSAPAGLSLAFNPGKAEAVACSELSRKKSDMSNQIMSSVDILISRMLPSKTVGGIVQSHATLKPFSAVTT